MSDRTDSENRHGAPDDEDRQHLLRRLRSGAVDPERVEVAVAMLENGAHDVELAEAIEAGGYFLPHDEPPAVRRSVSPLDKFVQIVPVAVNHLADVHGLTGGERLLLVHLALIVDYETAEAERRLTELADELGFTWRRLGDLFDGLARRGLVESHFPRGHMGRIRLWAYPQFVRLTPANLAALLDHLDQARPLEPARNRASAKADGARSQSRQRDSAIAPARKPIAPARERTGLSPMSASRDASVRTESRADGRGRPGADVGASDGDGPGGVRDLAPPEDECVGCVEPEESWLTDRTWMYPAIEEALA